jgi:hypothetical protein
MRDTILIVGDSWGVGEWDGNPSQDRIWQVPVSHSGLQHFLTEHDQKVINLSRPGNSNSEMWHTCIASLTNNLTLQESIRCIIIFQTEWTRDVCEHWHIAEVEDYGVEQLKSRWISRMYLRLSQLSCKYNLPVYVIGGCSDTLWLSEFSQYYPGVTIVCQSFTNLLLNNNHRIVNPIMISMHTRILESISKLKAQQLSLADKKFITQEIEQSFIRAATWENNPDWFYPDGYHPNKAGHKKLFDHLCSTVPNFLM